MKLNAYERHRRIQQMCRIPWPERDEEIARLDRAAKQRRDFWKRFWKARKKAHR